MVLGILILKIIILLLLLATSTENPRALIITGIRYFLINLRKQLVGDFELNLFGSALFADQF